MDVLGTISSYNIIPLLFWCALSELLTLSTAAHSLSTWLLGLGTIVGSGPVSDKGLVGLWQLQHLATECGPAGLSDDYVSKAFKCDASEGDTAVNGARDTIAWQKSGMRYKGRIPVCDTESVFRRLQQALRAGTSTLLRGVVLSFKGEDGTAGVPGSWAAPVVSQIIRYLRLGSGSSR